MPDFPPKKRFDKPKFQAKQPAEQQRHKEEPAEPNIQLIYGRHPVLEALQQGTSIEKVMILQSIRGEFEKEVRQACKQAEVLLQPVPKERLDAITRKNHQGIIGYMSAIEYKKLEDIIPPIFERGDQPLFVLLDGVTDVRNIGAIARSAEICGAHALVIPKKGMGSLNEEAIKTSAGALNILPVCKVANLLVAIDLLKENGIQTVAADIRGTSSLPQVDFCQPTAILMGAEGRGIAPELLKKTAATFRIPQLGKTDSFNVSVATGIILYESVRQRGELGKMK